MYDNERAQWWINRTQLPEYQKTYNIINSRIPQVKNGVFIEFGSGTGDNLKRIAQRSKYRTIIGLESSSLMLDYSQQLLNNANISSSTLNLEQLISPPAGIFLCQADILNSLLPSNIADTVLLSFPDPGFDCNERSDDLDLAKKLFGKFGELSKREFKKLFGTLRLQKTLSNLLKKGGTTIIVNYEASVGKDSKYEQEFIKDEKEFLSITGLNLERFTFYENPEVYNDTNDINPIHLIPNLKTGFFILKIRKS